MNKFLHLLTFLLALNLASAQTGKLISSEVFGVNEGLGHRIVLDIAADSLGRFYVLSPVGLQRYYREEIDATASVEVFDQHQSLIVGNGHFGVQDIEGCISIIDIADFTIDAKHCLNNYVDGAVLEIRSRQNKLLVLSIDGNNSYTVTHFETTKESLIKINERTFVSYEKILDVYLGKDEQLYYIDEGENFYKNGKLIYTAKTPAGQLKMEPLIFENTQTGIVYFSFRQSPGIVALSDEDVKEVHQGGFIHTYNEDENGNALIGVTENTVNFISDVLYIETEQDPKIWNELIEENDKILDFYSQDFSSEFILGSYNGLQYYYVNPLIVNSYLGNEEIAQGDFGTVIRCIGKGHNNRIKAVKESGEVVFNIGYDKASIDNDLLDIMGYGSNWFEYLAEDSSYYFGNYNGDFTSTIVKYNIENSQKEEYDFPMTLERFYIQGDEIWVVGNLTEQGKVTKINRRSHQSESYFDRQLMSKSVRSCLLTDEYFLVGTNGGLLHYDLLHQTATDSIIHNTSALHITCLREVGDNFLLGTQNEGLKVFTKDFVLVNSIEIGSSRSSNTVAAIETDEFDNLWISTFNGIVILNADYEIINKITLDDGLSSYEFNRDASFKAEDGTLYFGNLNGYTRINPKRFFEQYKEDDYLVDEVRYQIEDDQHLISSSQEIYNIVGVPEAVHIRLYHEGFSKVRMNPNLAHKDVSIVPLPDSFEISNDLISLYGLSDENYVITASSRYSESVPQVISQLNISKDFSWLQNVLLITLLIGSVSFLISKWIISVVKKESAVKIQLQNELSEIKMKALRSQLNPHFIFNSLNSIQYFIQVNEKRRARDYLSKFAKLMRMVLESSYNDSITVQKEIEQLKIYLDLEKLRFEEMWDYELHVDEDINSELTKIPSMLFQPIIENSILHGLGNLKDRKGMINIGFKSVANGIKVSIEDNGVGRVKSMDINSKKQRKPSSLSTAISKDRVALYNKYEDDYISIEYEDKYSQEGKPEGTKAIINISTSQNGTD